MNEMPWLRLYTDIIDHEKIRLLAFEDRWHYVALLCLKQKGILDDVGGLKERKIAVKLGLQLAEMDSLKKRLMEGELIDNEWQPLGWEDRQYESDTSAERTRKYRERLKNNKRDVTVTSPSRHSDAVVTVQETDTEKETDTETEKRSRALGADAPIVPQAEPRAPRIPPGEIEEIFDHWKTTLEHPNAQLSPARRKVITNARKAGYTVDNCKQAIDGCSKTPHNMGENDRGERYDSLELILRDAAHIDRFMRNAHDPPRARNSADRRLANNIANANAVMARIDRGEL